MKKVVFSSLVFLLVVLSLFSFYCITMSAIIISNDGFSNLFNFDIGQKYLLISLTGILASTYVFFKVYNFKP